VTANIVTAQKNCRRSPASASWASQMRASSELSAPARSAAAALVVNGGPVGRWRSVLVKVSDDDRFAYAGVDEETG
jgi:hypothetical protein